MSPLIKGEISPLEQMTPFNPLFNTTWLPLLMVNKRWVAPPTRVSVNC